MTKTANNINNEKNTLTSHNDGLEYLTEAEIEGINAGLEDITTGRTLTHEDVMARIDNKLNNWRTKFNK
jgi:predicted transcriptional regulator